MVLTLAPEGNAVEDNLRSNRNSESNLARFPVATVASK